MRPHRGRMSVNDRLLQTCDASGIMIKDEILFNERNPEGLYVCNNDHSVECATPAEVVCPLMTVFYKHVMPPASVTYHSNQSNKYSFLNSISNAFKNAKYSSLNVFPL